MRAARGRSDGRRGRCRRWTSFLVALLGVLSLGPVTARAFTLLPPASGYRAPEDPLRLRVPPEIPRERLARLAVELDGIDITGMLRYERGVLVFRPPTPLRPGPHRLRVVEYRPDGTLAEVAAFPFEVRESLAFREVDARVRAGARAARELRASPSVSSDPKAQLTGGADTALVLADGRWRTAGEARLTFTSRRLRPGRRLDLAHYRLGWTYDRLGLALGHLQPLPDGLASRGFATRGLTATLARGAPFGLELTAFAMRSEAVTGFEAFTGLGDRDRRVFGGRLALRPLGDPDALVLQATAHHGRGPTGGAGGVGGMASSEGSVLALGAAGRLAQDRFVWSAAIARSWWDADGPGALAERTTDLAWRAGLGYTGDFGGGVDGTEGWRWRIDGELIAAGPHYASLLGSTATRGQRRLTLAGTLARGAFEGRLVWKRAWDLTGGGSRLPESRRDLLELRLDYGFGESSALGLHELRATGTLGRTRPVRRVAGVAATDMRTLGLALEASGALLGADYAVTFEQTFADDRSSTDADEQERRLELELERGFLDGRLILRPRLALGWTRDEASRENTYEQELELGIELAPLWRDRHRLELTPYWNRSRDDAGPSEEIVYGIEGNLAFELLAAGPRRPGLTLTLAAAAEVRRDDVTGDEADSFRLFLALEAGWRGAY